jgi:ParB/RepB/Spo0J family partition protein
MAKSGAGVSKLETQAEHLWATPDATAAQRGGQGYTAKQLGRKKGRPKILNYDVLLWPTPNAADQKTSAKYPHKRGNPTLVMAAAFWPQVLPKTGRTSPGHSGRRLNPVFVCWLMGAPWYWTRAEPTSFGAQATASFRSALRSHLCACLTGCFPAANSPSLQRSDVTMSVAKSPSETNGHLVPVPIAKRMKGKLPGNELAMPLPHGEPRSLPEETERIHLPKLMRHPDNRHPTDEEVDRMAQSLIAKGQLDPILVRRLPPEKSGPLLGFEILSGETRVLAARKLGWLEIVARVVEADNAEALELLAVCNAARTDLNPIQKAQLIRRLCEPKEQGGSGLTRDQAAAIYGLKDGASASNLVKLLALPEVWQERVKSGEFPQSFARLLVAYVHAPRLMAAFDADYRAWQKKDYRAGDWSTRDLVEDTIEGIIRSETRATQGKRWYSFDHKGSFISGEFPVLFKLTPELEKELDIVEIADGKKTVRVATNVKRFDELQQALIVEKHAAKRTAGGKEKKPAKQREQTPAEKKAAAKEQARILAQRIERWRHRWIRGLIANHLRADVQGLDWIKVKLLLWLATGPNWPTHGDEQSLGLRDVITGSEPYGKSKSASFASSRDVWPELHAKHQSGAGYRDHLTSLTDIGKQMLIRLFATEDSEPGRYIVPLEVVEGAAADMSIDLAGEWITLQHAAELDQLEDFLGLHTSEQLDELGAELKRPVDHKPKKADKIILLKVAGQSGRLLPLPKSIKPLPIAAAAGAKKKKGAK